MGDDLEAKQHLSKRCLGKADNKSLNGTFSLDNLSHFKELCAFITVS